MSNTVLKFPLPKTKRCFRHWSLQLFLGSDTKYHRVPSKGAQWVFKAVVRSELVRASQHRFFSSNRFKTFNWCKISTEYCGYVSVVTFDYNTLITIEFSTTVRPEPA
jgi:hypothetical protein